MDMPNLSTSLAVYILLKTISQKQKNGFPSLQSRDLLMPSTDWGSFYRVKTTDRVEEAKYGILVPVCIEDEKDGYAGKLSKEEILMADAMRKILQDPALVRYYRKASLERAEQLDMEPGDYAYAYRYPTNCVTIRKLFDEQYRDIPEYQRYKILSNKAGRIIYTNVAKCVAEYTADVTDCAMFDDGFVEALSWKLAGDIAFKLTANQNIQSQCLQAYNAYFEESSVDAVNEQNEMDPRLDSFAMARY